MTFNEEKTGYEKTILSDLQGAWGCLRESVVKSFGGTSGTPLILTSRYLFRKKKEQKNENLGDGPEKNLEATGSGTKNKKDKKIMLEMLDTERKF